MVNGEKEIGRIVLCNARKDGETRLFIHNFNKYVSIMRNHGWWDMFTISNKPVKDSGFYLCQIVNFRIDNNGWPNMIVAPVKYIGRDMDEHSIAWNYLLRSDIFTRQYSYVNDKFIPRFNEDKLTSEMGKLLNVPEDNDINSAIVDAFMSGIISLDDIANLLNAKTDLELLADDMRRNLRKYDEQYPLLVAAIRRDYDKQSVFDREGIKDFLKRKRNEYDNLVLQFPNGFETTSSTHILDIVECVYHYWNRVKENRKRDKKNKRLERGVNKNA